MRFSALLLVGLLTACGRSHRTEGDTSPSASTKPTATTPVVDNYALEKEAQTKATQAWLSLHKSWQAVDAVVSKKGALPKPCSKTSPPNNAVGLSIGQAQIEDLAKPGARHNYLFMGGGTTSSKLSDAIRVPFLESEHGARDWSPRKAAVALSELEKSLFPLTVLRIDNWVAPEVTGPKSFRGGRADTIVFFFESATTVCTVKISTQSEKAVSAMTFGGETGGRDVVNLRMANDLEQSVQRAAGIKLAQLGKLGSLDPAVAKR